MVQKDEMLGFDCQGDLKMCNSGLYVEAIVLPSWVQCVRNNTELGEAPLHPPLPKPPLHAPPPSRVEAPCTSDSALGWNPTPIRNRLLAEATPSSNSALGAEFASPSTSRDAERSLFGERS